MKVLCRQRGPECRQPNEVQDRGLKPMSSRCATRENPARTSSERRLERPRARIRGPGCFVREGTEPEPEEPESNRDHEIATPTSGQAAHYASSKDQMPPPQLKEGMMKERPNATERMMYALPRPSREGKMGYNPRG